MYRQTRENKPTMRYRITSQDDISDEIPPFESIPPHFFKHPNPFYNWETYTIGIALWCVIIVTGWGIYQLVTY